ncbi:MAG: squalene/phytoene synthase family protein, partial [Anaerolineae bacterium]|nr:squalene/phytoene synthase family protein [Anaerolineae bacterium]
MTVSATWESQLLAQAYAPLENLITNETTPVQQSLLDKAYAHATAVTAAHSRTFYTASALLPAAERRAIRALYAFCRVSDDLIDRQQDNRCYHFRQWRQRALSSHPPEDRSHGRRLGRCP